MTNSCCRGNLQCQAVQPSLVLTVLFSTPHFPHWGRTTLTFSCGHAFRVLALKPFPLGISFPKPQISNQGFSLTFPKPEFAANPKLWGRNRQLRRIVRFEPTDPAPAKENAGARGVQWKIRAVRWCWEQPQGKGQWLGVLPASAGSLSSAFGGAAPL